MTDRHKYPRQVRVSADVAARLDAAAALLGAVVVERQLEITSPDYRWLTATCDAAIRFVDSDQCFPLEVKTTSNPAGYPHDYLEAQLHAQMLCMQVDRGFSATRNLVTGQLLVVEHRADPKITVAVVEMGETLWNYLTTGAIPQPVFPADNDLWNKLHPRSTDKAVELPDTLVDELREAKDAAAQATNRLDLVEAEIKELLGEADTGTVNGTPVIRLRTVTSRRVDLKALEADAPDLVETHRKESTVRRFTLISPPINQHRKAIP